MTTRYRAGTAPCLAKLRGRAAGTQPAVNDGKTEAEFIAFRQARDSTPAAPTLWLPSIQVHTSAGRFLEAKAKRLTRNNHFSYLAFSA